MSLPPRDLNSALVHYGVTVAFQATGIIPHWANVIFGVVEGRIVVHLWQQTAILRNDAWKTHMESTDSPIPRHEASKMEPIVHGS